MSVQSGQDRTSSGSCWCCGAEHPEPGLLRLGLHPEVGVCLECARWLQRRVVQRYDELHPSLAARLRSGIRGLRAAVISKGWHNRGALGRVLRWIDRRLPQRLALDGGVSAFDEDGVAPLAVVLCDAFAYAKGAEACGVVQGEAGPVLGED